MALARIHLDPVGGLAGDMFAAAMADAFPECVPGLMQELGKLGGASSQPSALASSLRAEAIRFVACTDGAIAGKRFVVECPAPRTAPHTHGPGEPDHLHVPHRAIRARLESADLAPEVLRHALGLFSLLAEAEAQVHGITPDAVEFHEVGAWDSIVDFVAAAYFIATLAPERWTCAPLPLGGGRVQTAHGILPVPAPATTLLLRGLAVVDDGIGGERVTPTGAAIAAYLTRGAALHTGTSDVPSREIKSLSPVVVAGTGYGFGSRKLAGMANMVRVVAFAREAAPGPRDEEIVTLQFEIDDQSAEELAVALERVRQVEGVLDASQLAVYGKKNRLATQVQVIARPDAADAAADACLAHTTTLGVRIARVRRRIAPRAEVQAAVPEPVRVKMAERPGGRLTAKAQMEDIARLPGDRVQREQARERAESQALEMTRRQGPDDRRDD
jgi:pyridinium-3,5-bisthiocarboxylic acid mononucleotide nickel chelatase